MTLGTVPKSFWNPNIKPQVAFTGKLYQTTWSRDEAVLVANSVKMRGRTGSVTWDTSLLVVGENPGKGKLDLAKQRQVLCIDEREFVRLVARRGYRIKDWQSPVYSWLLNSFRQEVVDELRDEVAFVDVPPEVKTGIVNAEKTIVKALRERSQPEVTLPVSIEMLKTRRSIEE